MAATSIRNTTLESQRVLEAEEDIKSLDSEAKRKKMVRTPSIDKNGLKKGAWSKEEDNKLRAYIERYGHWNWRQLPKYAGLARCGKSCRLRWLNYLKPGVKRGNFTAQEDELIIKLHKEFGSKWSVIASKFPGRTDNDIKNHWNTHLRRPMKQDCKTSKSTGETRERSDQMDDSAHHEESSSMTTSHSIQKIDDQMGTNIYNRFSGGDHAYSEVSSLNCDSTLIDGVLDFLAAEDGMDLLESSMERFNDESFWNEFFASGSSFDNNHHHLQFPASLEEEINRPFTPHLAEMNVDWLHELMQ